jgi:adenylosuccinate lyase
MALAEKLGRHEAHQLVQQLTLHATQTGASFRTVLVENTTIQQHLTIETIDDLLDPANYLGSAQAIIQRVLQAHRAKGGR